MTRWERIEDMKKLIEVLKGLVMMRETGGIKAIMIKKRSHD